MARRARIEVASRLEAAPEEIWSWVVTAEGVNDELHPLAADDYPRRRLRSELGRHRQAHRSQLGSLPRRAPDRLRRDQAGEIDEGRGFVERSKMLSQRWWEHIRTIRPGDGGAVVTDAVAWEPRLPLAGAAMRPLFRAIFGHRHRRLRKRFGGVPAAADGS
jgi:ligand-binding SRPBCC domain-containing protein